MNVKPECYHVSSAWSADSCNKCEHDMDCYHHWLLHMTKHDDRKEHTVAKLAVMGCHRNPQAQTTAECLACEFKNGMCNEYALVAKLYDKGYIVKES